MKKLLILVFVLILVAGCSFEVKKTESVETGITSFEVITDEENNKAVAEEAIANEVEQEEDRSDEETTSEEVSTDLTIEDTATEEDQKSAVRLTEDYLREKMNFSKTPTRLFSTMERLAITYLSATPH